MPWTRLCYVSKILLFMDTFMERVHTVDMKEQTYKIEDIVYGE